MRVEPDVQLLSTILVHDNDYDEKFRWVILTHH
jgi:hypothetical protein